MFVLSTSGCTAWATTQSLFPAGTSKAQAKALHGQWLAEVETRIERIRAAAKGTGQPLTQRNVLALAGEWYC